MLEPDQIFALVMTLIICSTLVILIGVRYWFKSRTSRSARIDQAQIGRLEERLTQTQQAIDAIAVEVERISEGQRFTTKLLSERAEERAER